MDLRMNKASFKPSRRLVLGAGVVAALTAAVPAGAQTGERRRSAGRAADEDAVKPASGAISPLMSAVSDYIVHAADKPLPAPALEATKQHLLDTFAAMVSGSRLPPGEKAIAYVKQLGGRPEACIP